MASIRKRQKKGEVQGDFKCKYVGCHKGYLSYPALYTHIKSKHGDDFLKDMERPATQGSRGRPKREDLQTFPVVQEEAPLQLQIQIESKQSIDDFLLELCDMNCKFILQQEAEIIKNGQILNEIELVCEATKGILGGQIYDVSFMEKLREIFGRQECTMTIIDNLIFVTCDEAFSLFMKELSYTVNIRFLQSVAYFLLCLRHSINQKYDHNFCQTGRPTQLGDQVNTFLRDKGQFYINSAKLTRFYAAINDQQQRVFSKEQGEELWKKLAGHLCNWMYSSRYSDQKLMLS